MQWLSFLIYCGFVLAITDGTMFLERGSRGIVPCPLVESRQISRKHIDAMYWYYDSTSRTSLLISYFLGRVAPQNGIPEGVYDIDSEFSLVIENVTASNEGTYFWKLKPHLEIEEGQVEVCVKVSPRRPYPTVIGCNQDHDADTCEMRVRHDSTVHNLTCVMEQVKPAVELRWLHLFLGGKTELKASTSVWPEVLPTYTGASLRSNTYSTSASVQVTTVDGDNEAFVCEAIGIAVGKGAHMRVRFTKAHHNIVSREEVQSDNPGTTLVWADEVSPIACKPAQNTVPGIALGVAFIFSFIFIAILCILVPHDNGRLVVMQCFFSHSPDPINVKLGQLHLWNKPHISCSQNMANGQLMVRRGHFFN
ncbi:uncharacterized protein LOC119736702 [Patiria miniata]|uniref:Ig-like domain-containing protein n=1 Tax=Patiria miniata TaxID=46514 RepID=A0A914AT42_PATMI|nr:uncharacterized protein LOC119736702 [Patiria miniata]